MRVQGGRAMPSNTGHFFAAYRVDAFREVDAFKQDMDTLVRALRNCPPQPGVARVLVPGEHEHRTAAQRSSAGIPLHADAVATLRTIAADFNLEPVA